jgi:hypothetical protein
MKSSAPLQQIKPTSNDVIYGRGIAANQHNQSFRAEIRSRHDSYARGNAKTELEMVTELMRVGPESGRSVPQLGIQLITSKLMNRL